MSKFKPNELTYCLLLAAMPATIFFVTIPLQIVRIDVGMPFI